MNNFVSKNKTILIVENWGKEKSIKGTQENRMDCTMCVKEELTNEQLTSRFKAEARLPINVGTFLSVRKLLKGI